MAAHGAGMKAAAARMKAVPAAANPPLEASGAAQGDNSTAAAEDTTSDLQPHKLPSTPAIPRSSGSTLKLQLADGRSLHSFPFPLNLRVLCPFPLNLSSLRPPYDPY